MAKPALTEKTLLTLAEAEELYTISRAKVKQYIKANPDCGLAMFYGKRVLLIRPIFAEFIKDHPELRRREYVEHSR